MQICRVCKLEKPIFEFHKSSRHKSGVETECRDCCNLRKRLSYETPEVASHKASYRVARSEENIAYQKKYREDNKEVLLEKRRLKVDHKAETDRIYRAANPDKICAKSAKRRAIRNQAIPAWSNATYIAIFYQMAKDEESRTGRKVEVDHIVPLNSELVCGLHCEDNLQLLFKEDNALKGNRVWPEMP